MGTDEIIRLISDLGLPVSISIGLAYCLYKVIMWLLKDVVHATLDRFNEKHKVLKSAVDEIQNDIQRIKKWNAEIKSDFKLIIDIMMKKEK